jgi:hypothetical protein
MEAEPEGDDGDEESVEQPGERELEVAGVQLGLF